MAAEAVKQQLGDITECPICVTSFTDPRVLPCVHTYCYRCRPIKTWCKDKRNGSKATCPMCRKDFVIPDGGVEELPKNFFLTKLLSIKDLSFASSEVHLCDLCSTSEGAKNVSATMFCLDCHQKQCAACHFCHSNFKQFQSHKTISIDKISENELCSKFPPSHCGKHKDECVKLCCF